MTVKRKRFVPQPRIAPGYVNPADPDGPLAVPVGRVGRTEHDDPGDPDEPMVPLWQPQVDDRGVGRWLSLQGEAMTPALPPSPWVVWSETHHGPPPETPVDRLRHRLAGGDSTFLWHLECVHGWATWTLAEHDDEDQTHRVERRAEPPEDCPFCRLAQETIDSLEILSLTAATAREAAWFEAGCKAGETMGLLRAMRRVERAARAGRKSVQAGDDTVDTLKAKGDALAAERYPKGVDPDTSLRLQGVLVADLPDKVTGRARGPEESARRLAPGPLPQRPCEADGCGRMFTPRARDPDNHRFCCPACRKRQNSRDDRARNARPK